MEDWSGTKARGTGWRWRRMVEWPFLIVVAFFLTLAARSYFDAHVPARGSIDPRAVELAHLKMLGHALKLHADEHEGKFPPSIAEIHWRENLPGMGWAGLPAAVSRFHDPETGKLSDWLYYPGHTENDPPDTILVAAPVALGKGRDRRMVARVNGVAEIIAEADFLRPIPEPAAP